MLNFRLFLIIFNLKINQILINRINWLKVLRNVQNFAQTFINLKFFCLPIFFLKDLIYVHKCITWHVFLHNFLLRLQKNLKGILCTLSWNIFLVYIISLLIWLIFKLKFNLLFVETFEGKRFVFLVIHPVRFSVFVLLLLWSVLDGLFGFILLVRVFFLLYVWYETIIHIFWKCVFFVCRWFETLLGK